MFKPSTLDAMAYDLERVVMLQLRRGSGEERFELPGSIEPLLSRALDRDLSRPEPLPAIHAALKLAAAFADGLQSPSIAARIRAVLRSDVRAIRLISDRLLNDRPINRARSFAEREGRPISLQAPKESDLVPVDSVPLRAFLDNAGGIRMPRVVRRGGSPRR